MAKAKTKTKRKKPISTTRSAVVFTVLALMCVLYFYYLSNRGASVENINSSTNDTELSTLLNKNIDAAYPESPKEVVKLYARYTKQFYKDGLTDDQVSKLGNQARILLMQSSRHLRLTVSTLKVLRLKLQTISPTTDMLRHFLLMKVRM